MNVRKRIDYSLMYKSIDEVMAQELPQMQMYCAIGKIVCSRTWTDMFRKESRQKKWICRCSISIKYLSSFPTIDAY